MKIVVALLVAVPLAAIGVAVLNAYRQSEPKSYFFPRVEIDADLRQDGTLEVHERRTFDFTGPFTFAFFTIDSTSTAPDRIRKFRISDRGRDLSASTSVNQAGDFEATWRFDARDERRTFDIRYEVTCAADVYGDAGHLLWQFVGTGWSEVTKLVQVTVHLPDPATERVRRSSSCDDLREAAVPTRPMRDGEVRAWGHGPLAGELEIPDPNTVVLTVRDLMPRQFVEGSILFPEASVPLAPRFVNPGREEVIGGAGGEAVIGYEDRLREETRSLARRATLETGFTYALYGLVPLAMAGLVLWSRRRDRIPGLPQVIQEPPGEGNAVNLSLLWAASRKRFEPKTAYRTQFLHLARTGVIDLASVGPVSEPTDFLVSLKKQPDNPGDAAFVNYLFAGDRSRSLSLKDVRATGERKDLLRDWWEIVANRNKGMITQFVSGRTRMEGVVAWLVAGAAGLYSWWRWTDLESTNFLEPLTNPRGLVGFPAAWLIPITLVSLFIALRSMRPRVGERLRSRVAKWEAFRRFLTEFSTFEDAPALAVIVWERYLELAVALGVADEVERQVRAVIPTGDLPQPWEGAPEGVGGYQSYRHWSHSSPSYAPAGAAAAVGWSSGWGSGAGRGGGGGFSGGGGGGGGGTGGGAG